MFSLKEKVALVTGGANGIGACVVREFVKEGAKFVAIIDINESGIELENELVTQHGGGVVCFFQCDVKKVGEIFDVFSKVIKSHGCIDIVVNNAGIAKETLETFSETVGVNFTATVASSLKALELMRVDHGGRGGTIMNVSSIMALSYTFGRLPIYAGTKSAVLHFSTRLGSGDFFARTNVRVLTLCFGLTNTNILHTYESFDEEVNESMQTFSARYKHSQTPKVAAKGVVQTYKNGKSGSTWAVSKGQVSEITDKIDKVTEIMNELYKL